MFFGYYGVVGVEDQLLYGVVIGCQVVDGQVGVWGQFGCQFCFGFFYVFQQGDFVVVVVVYVYVQIGFGWVLVGVVGFGYVQDGVVWCYFDGGKQGGGDRCVYCDNMKSQL